MPPSVKYLDRDGALTITSKSWVDAFAGRNQVSIKFGIENTGDRALGSSPGPAAGFELQITEVEGNDGSTFLRHALDSATVGTPYTVEAELLDDSLGAFAATGNYFYRVTATNALGETIGSVEIVINVEAVDNRVLLTWVQPTGATGYRVWRSTTSGTYGPTALLTTIAGGGTVTYTDDGDATVSGTIPTTNTTAGWNLSAVLGVTADGGVWTGTGIRYWRIVAIDATGVEMANSFEAFVNVDDVTKRVTLSWTAVPGADTYRIYRSTSSGSYISALRASIAPAVSYIDNGGAVTAGDLTTEPSYGIPPASGSFVQAALVLAVLRFGEQRFFWVNRVVPGATSEAGNRRLALTKAVEV